MKTSLASNYAPGFVLAILVAFLAFWPVPNARAGDDHVEARELLKQGKILPLTKILALAQARVPGDVIEVELDQEESGWEYKVKVLTPSGQVRKLTLDASSGVVLKVRDD